MQLHPITVYWLLEELKAEGARCKPEIVRRGGKDVAITDEDVYLL